MLSKTHKSSATYAKLNQGRPRQRVEGSAPQRNGLNQEEELEFQALLVRNSLDSKQIHRFRRLRAKRSQPEKEMAERSGMQTEALLELLKALSEKTDKPPGNTEWESIRSKARKLIAAIEG